MASIEISNLAYALPGGHTLFQDITFRVPENGRTALVGANGTGKTTLLRLIAGHDNAMSGFIRVDGHAKLMQQLISPGDTATVRDFLVDLSDQRITKAAQALRRSERAAAESSAPKAHLAYADELARWSELGGYDAEVLWDTCASAALGLRLEEVADRPLATLSGGEQKRLALECLFRSDADVLLLDEPDNFLDVRGKEWLEAGLNSSPKTILFVSHDRELLARTSTRVVTLEAHGAWVHPGSFATYHEARAERLEQIDTERRLYSGEQARLMASMKEFKRRAAISDKFASRAKAAESRLKRFEKDNAPRERARPQAISMGLKGGRTGKIALRLRKLALTGLVEAFDAEIYYGERVGIVGANGTGKTHFLKLLSGEPVAHEGEVVLGARVEASIFSQAHDRPDLGSAKTLDIMRSKGLDMSASMSGLKRYELHHVATNPFSLLSGGQQARFQLLLMELANPTMLLLDEPTDNLDVESAEALEAGLEGYEGTVLAVTHDRWFMHLMDRFLIFNADGAVLASVESPY